MLTRLVLGAVRKDIASWLALIIASTVVAVVFTLDIGLIAAGVHAEEEAQQAFVAMGSVALGFSILTGLASLHLVSGICLRLQQRSVSLWQVIGIQPRTALLVILGQVFLIAVLSALVGTGLSLLLWRPFANFVAHSGLPYSPTLHEGLPLLALIIGIASTAIMSVLAGIFTAPRVVKANLLEGLREEPGQRRRPAALWRFLKISLALAAIAGIIALYSVIARVPERETARDTGDFLTTYAGMGMLLCIVFAFSIGGPLNLLLRLCTKIGSHSIGWFLASREASARPALTRALAIPIALAGGAIGVMFAWVTQLGESLSVQEVSAPPEQMALLFAGPVIVACTAAASVIYATARNRMKDTALLLAGGGTRTDIYRKSAAEIVLYFSLALITAYLIVIINDYAMAWALRQGPIPQASTVLPSWHPLAVVAFGTVLITALLLSINSASLKQSIVETVGKE